MHGEVVGRAFVGAVVDLAIDRTAAAAAASVVVVVVVAAAAAAPADREVPLPG